MASRPDGVRREVLVLVGLVLAVDAAFIAGYYVAGVGRATSALKIGYTVLWTAATLLVVLRGLHRVRAERIRRRRAGA
jgi:hypothetical protein